MKKTWLKVKRGLLTPEHIDKLGPRVWLYLYMLDLADWDTGTIHQWTDRAAGEALGIPSRTVKDQRERLAADGYITTERAFQHSRVTILKWVNPREYSGKVYNLPDVAVLDELHRDTQVSGSRTDAETNADTHTDTHTDTVPQGPSLSPQVTGHIKAALDTSTDATSELDAYLGPRAQAPEVTSLSARTVDVDSYPPHVQGTVLTVCEVWGHKPPEPKSHYWTFWVKGAAELQDACGEFPVRDIVAAIHGKWEAEGARISITSPMSLVNLAREEAARRRQAPGSDSPAARMGTYLVEQPDGSVLEVSR